MVDGTYWAAAGFLRDKGEPCSTDVDVAFLASLCEPIAIGFRQRWLMASPFVLAAALLDPRIFQLLITNGQGGGALAVVVIGVTGAYALSGRGSRTCATISGLVALLLIVACGSVAADSTPLTTPHGAWIATQAVSLLGVLCVACSIPYRTTRVSLLGES